MRGKDDAQAAINRAFGIAVEHLFERYRTGLMSSDVDVAHLAKEVGAGIGIAIRSHRDMWAIVDRYFEEHPE